MRHERLRSLLGEYVDGALPGADRGRVEEHLESCAGCRTELERLRRLVGLLRELPAVDAPAHFTTRVMARLRAEEEAPGWLARAGARLAGLGDSAWLAPFSAAALGVGLLFALQDVEIRFQLGGGASEAMRPAALATRTPEGPGLRASVAQPVPLLRALATPLPMQRGLTFTRALAPSPRMAQLASASPFPGTDPRCLRSSGAASFESGPCAAPAEARLADYGPGLPRDPRSSGPLQRSGAFDLGSFLPPAPRLASCAAGRPGEPCPGEAFWYPGR